MSRLKHFLWEIGKKTLIIAVIELMILAFIASPIGAVQVYLGGYSTNTQPYDTEHVIMDCRIPPGVPIPSGNFLLGVLSVAGVEDGGLSGWIYQIGVARQSNGDLWWTTQSWYLTFMRDYHAAPLPDPGSWAAIYVRMDVGDSMIHSRIWGYKDDIYHLSYAQGTYIDMNDGEDSFRVGTYRRLGRTYKHFQFGVESPYEITGYTWYCYQYRVGYYYDGRWRYQPAKVVHGDDSWITRKWWRQVKIGGANYDGVNRAFASSGNVIWKYTGITVPNGTWLWANQGSLQTFPAEPFAI